MNRVLSRKRIISCVMLNLVATPGLGTLIARRWVAGIGQVGLSVVGFVLLMVWFYKLVIEQFYGQISGNVTVQPVGYIGLAGAGLFAVAWLWSLGTSLSLMREASQVNADSLKLFGASLVKMDEAGLSPALASLPNWKREGQTISRTYEFKDFPAAMKFVKAVAELAEQVQHHPDIDVRWNRVTLALTTHDAGGLTAKDFALARECDEQALEA
jgi:4a-hydroxytetrahydrobiopterin dehydratase